MRPDRQLRQIPDWTTGRLRPRREASSVQCPATGVAAVYPFPSADVLPPSAQTPLTRSPLSALCTPTSPAVGAAGWATAARRSRRSESRGPPPRRGPVCDDGRVPRRSCRPGSRSGCWQRQAEPHGRKHRSDEESGLILTELHECYYRPPLLRPLTG